MTLPLVEWKRVVVLNKASNVQSYNIMMTPLKVLPFLTLSHGPGDESVYCSVVGLYKKYLDV